MTPVYWKPRYPTRQMRERAYAKRDLAREEAAKRGTRRGRWLERLRAWLRR